MKTHAICYSEILKKWRIIRDNVFKKCSKAFLTIVICVIFLFTAYAGAGFTSSPFDAPVDTLRFEPSTEISDTLEYELIIIDPDFDSWFLRNSRPIGFYNEQFLESWNQQLVSQWNNAIFTHRNRDCRPTTYLDYDPDIDYGVELNHKLFYYFKFMQERCRIFLTFPGPGR